MPELPEVETVKKGLNPYLLNKSIRHVDVLRLDLRIKAPENTKALILNQKVTSLSRRSKYLYIHLDNAYTLIIHLGMSGTLTIQSIGTPLRKHDHLILKTDKAQIHFNDPRRFGFYDIQKTEKLNELKYIKNLGVEPFSNKFTPKYLTNIMRSKSKPIKNTLMDNALIVGIGNIYACEILFDAQISPFISSKCVDNASILRLYASIIKILTEAIKSGGSSLKDFKQVTEKLGYFQHSFKVYNQEGMPCSYCSMPIVRLKQSGRSTFFCIHCQGVSKIDLPFSLK